MQIGIIGLPQSGKTEVFKLVTGEAPSVSGTLQKSVVQIPDTRLDHLSEMLDSKKKTSATAEFVDARARDEKDKSTSETVTALRDSDLLLAVVRGFATPGMETHAENDYTDILTDLTVIDLDIVLKRLEKLEKPVKKNMQDQVDKEKALLEKAREALESEKQLSDVDFDAGSMKILRSFQFLTLTPLVFIFNTDENNPDIPATLPEGTLRVFASLENELMEMDPDERSEFMEDMGIAEFSRNKIITACLHALDMISFYTAGEKESKAYLVPRNTNIVTAAGKIHSDIEKGFIRAEVFNYEKFVAAGSYKQAKANGDMLLVSKDYEVQDGDMLDIRFNV